MKAPAGGMVLVVCIAAAAGCRATVVNLGFDGAGHAHGAAIMEAIAVHLQREGSNDAFGPYQDRLTAQVLTPSLLWRDPAMWTERSPTERTLRFVGRRHQGSYALFPHQWANTLPQVGDARYAFSLAAMGTDLYRWRTLDEYQVGRVSLAQVLAGWRATFGAVEHANGKALHHNALTTFPRAAQAFSNLMALEEVRASPHPQGGSVATLILRVVPQKLRAAGYRQLATYVDRYITPLQLEGSLRNAAGAPFGTVSMGNNRIRIQWRAHNGVFVPLEGPAIAVGDQFRMHFNVSTKVFMLTVGADDVWADIQVVRSPQEVGWLMRFHTTPDWVVPLGAAGLVRASLDRPFEGRGVLLHMGLRRSAQQRTVAFRRIAAELEENMLMRFWARVVRAIGNDFVKDTEAEGYRFFRLGADAMRQDALAVQESRPTMVEAAASAP